MIPLSANTHDDGTPVEPPEVSEIVEPDAPVPTITRVMAAMFGAE